MFTVSVETSFRAPHQLTLPDGSKEPVHSHDWLVNVDVGSATLNNMGVVMDFRRLRAMVDNIVAEFDSKVLNEFSYLQQTNPSAENVAIYIYEELKPKLPKGVKLRSIRVVEEPGCSAKYETTDEASPLAGSHTDSSGLTQINL